MEKAEERDSMARLKGPSTNYSGVSIILILVIILIILAILDYTNVWNLGVL